MRRTLTVAFTLILVGSGVVALLALTTASAEDCPKGQALLPCGGHITCQRVGSTCCGASGSICKPSQTCYACGGKFVCAQTGSSCCHGSMCRPDEYCAAEAGSGLNRSMHRFSEDLERSLESKSLPRSGVQLAGCAV